MTTDLALTRPDPTMDEASLRVMMAAADRYVKSGLLPAEVNTPQKALVIMTAGREMGVPATYALRNIHVVKGKPVCSAELLLALVRRSYGSGAIRVAKTSNTACTVQYREQGWDGISEYTFTIEDARAAGVTNNPTWKNYPAAMLRARCISAVVRFAFPEAIAGLYTPEELGAAVTVDGEGEVQYVDGEVLSTTPAPDGAGPAYCDEDHYRKAWHAAVKGTRFEDDETRHKFMSWYTQGSCSSLVDFLKGSTDGEASDLIATVKARIEDEARKAARVRESLLAELRDVIGIANDLAQEEMFDVPDDIATWTDEQIRDQIAVIQQTIAAAQAA
jgi:hypothetical protein